MVKLNEKYPQFREKKLTRQCSIVSSTLSGRVTQWDNTLLSGTLLSESEGFRLESHWCTRSGFGIQPHYEAPSDLRVVLAIVLWLTLSQWSYLPSCFSVLFSFSIKKTNICCSILAVLQGRYLRLITMQPIRQLLWTDVKAPSKNLIISFLENKGYNSCMMVRIAFVSGCLYNSITIVWNADFLSYPRRSFFYLLILQSKPSADI